MSVNDYTPQQIEEILQAFFDVAGTRQYIGARYVPVFGHGGDTPIEWDGGAEVYEPLSIVYWQGETYTSRRYVPAGIDIQNGDYWVVTANYNAQMEQYRQEVLSFQGQIDDTNAAVDTLRDDVEQDYVPFPDSDHYAKYGTLGQVLSTLADGSTMWQDPVVPSDAQAEEVITTWLNDHPEATTTVQDGAITDAKVADAASILLLRPAVYITDLNDVTTAGYYMLGVNQEPANCPITGGSGTGVRRLLTVYRISANYYAQSIVTTNGGLVYYRATTDHGSTWSDWTHYPIDESTIEDGAITDAKVADAASILLLRTAAYITDLNDVTTAGYYMLGVNQEPANCPITGGSGTGVRRLLTVYRITDNYYAQTIVSTNQGIVYYRATTDGGSTWTDWVTYVVPDGAITDAKVADAASILLLRTAAYITDLNDVTTAGYYMLGVNQEPANCPITGGSGTGVRRLLTVYRITGNYYAQTLVSTNQGIVYYRATTDGGSTWTPWARYEDEGVIKSIQAPSSMSSIGLTTKVGELTLMTYNVAHYDNDTETTIDTEHLIRLKQMLSQSGADIVMTQEDRTYIDGDSTKTADGWVYQPLYDRTHATGNQTKSFSTRPWLSVTSVSAANLQSGRNYVHGTLHIGSTDISVYDVHCYPGFDAESISLRLQDWNELRTILNNDSATYKIMCGDFNVTEDEASFESVFSGYNFANGGYLGWFATAYASARLTYPCDNIITTPNILIDSIEPLGEWGHLLYSDHVPLCAHLTLMSA